MTPRRRSICVAEPGPGFPSRHNDPPLRPAVSALRRRAYSQLRDRGQTRRLIPTAAAILTHRVIPAQRLRRCRWRCERSEPRRMAARTDSWPSFEARARARAPQDDGHCPVPLVLDIGGPAQPTHGEQSRFCKVHSHIKKGRQISLPPPKVSGGELTSGWPPRSGRPRAWRRRQYRTSFEPVPPGIDRRHVWWCRKR